MTRVLDAQPSLFDASRTVERELPTGVTVRLRLEPLADQRVRVIEYRRKVRAGARWERRAGEEGRVYALASLGLELPFEAIFA